MTRIDRVARSVVELYAIVKEIIGKRIEREPSFSEFVVSRSVRFGERRLDFD